MGFGFLDIWIFLGILLGWDLVGYLIGMSGYLIISSDNILELGTKGLMNNIFTHVFLLVLVHNIYRGNTPINQL